MRDEIVRRNVILLSISLVIFFVLSIIMFSLSSRKTLEKVLENNTILIINDIKDTNTEAEMISVGTKYTDSQSWLSIKAMNSNGLILFDSRDDSSSEYKNKRIDQKYIDKAKNEYSISESGYVYSKDGRICLITYVNDDLFIETSVETEDISYYILVALLVISVSLLVVVLLSIIFTRKTTDKVVESFKMVKNNLEKINNNNYVREYDRTNYEEVNEVVDQINEVNDKIYNQMINITHEHDKLDFIIDNMEQGIIIIDKESNILLINKYALHAIDKKNTMSLLNEIKYYNIFSNEYLINKIKESLTNSTNQFFDCQSNDGKIYLYDLSISNRSWQLDKPKDEILFILVKDVTTERINDTKKAEFISNASHELKSPVTSIKGFAEILAENSSEYDSLTKKAIDVIYKQSIRMQDTITELLYLSSLENKVLEDNELEITNLSEMIDEAFQNNQYRANAKNIRLMNKVNKDIEFKTKQALFIHLISNLVDNGIKYNTRIDGDGFVLVETEMLDKTINIKVSDNGQGIDEKSINHIFERFYRVDESHNDKIKGTGLGLHIVSQICNVLNAKISVSSKVGVGTTFTISINK